MMFLPSILVFSFGAILGSFVNALAFRLPKEQTILGRSRCPACAKTLTWWQLVPIVSFLALLGKCHFCKKPIHPRYVLGEAVSGTLFVLAFWRFLPYDLFSSLELIVAWLIVLVAILVFTIDLEYYLILDKVVGWSFAGFLVLLLWMDFLSFPYFSGSFPVLSSGVISGILGAFLSALFLWVIWFVSQGRAMGFGDVKFMLPFGFTLGFPWVFFGLGLASLLGACFGVLLLIFGKAKWSSRLPFGTFLAVAWVVTFFYAEFLWTQYIGWLTSVL